MPIAEDDHGIDCLCDECWPGTPRCRCLGPPDYYLGLGIYACIRCKDRANEIAREIILEAGCVVVVACPPEMEGVDDDVRLDPEVRGSGPDHG